MGDNALKTAEFLFSITVGHSVTENTLNKSNSYVIKFDF